MSRPAVRPQDNKEIPLTRQAQERQAARQGVNPITPAFRRGQIGPTGGRVASAGNDGRDNTDGTNGYGTITAPGNDPYVITVGAMNTMGTPVRSDDIMTTYSGLTMWSIGVGPLELHAKRNKHGDSRGKRRRGFVTPTRPQLNSGPD